MARYDYECSKCEHLFEEVHGMLERPQIKCPKCGARADKLFGLPHTHQDKLYDFVDVNTTGKPIKFTSKGQWQRHLKKTGLTDDIPQRPIKANEIKTGGNVYEKQKKKKEYKELLGSVYQEVKQKSWRA